MHHRSEDRRGSSRFEILGTLVGSLEIWQRLDLRNLNAFGALVETSEFYSPGTPIRGRLTVQEHTVDVRGDVRHVSPVSHGDARTRYLVGVEFSDELSAIGDWLAEQSLTATAPLTSDVMSERRRSPRFDCAGDADIRVPAWVTVTLKDLSSSGTMFASKRPLELGSRSSLRTRLGDRTFAAEVEVRRAEGSGVAGRTECRVGASFVSMDEESRRNLAAFLATAAG